MNDGSIHFRQLPHLESSPGTMIWFPHAGGTSAAVVRRTRDQSLAVCTKVVVLPGREELWNEPASELSPIIDAIATSIATQVTGPCCLAGHSFGALLAFLVTEELCRRERSPELLMPMAIAPPDRLKATAWHLAPDNELIEHLDHTYGAIPSELRNKPDALGRFLPIVRHDLRLMETYTHEPSAPLPVDLVICGGTNDPAVDEPTLRGWRRFTQASWDLQLFMGDHFFPYLHFQAITELVARRLA